MVVTKIALAIVVAGATGYSFLRPDTGQPPIAKTTGVAKAVNQSQDQMPVVDLNRLVSMLKR